MLRILLVDKNNTSRNALRDLIAVAGAECVDGTESTIRHAGQAGFDAVITVNATAPAPADIPVLHCYMSNPGTDVIAHAIARGAAEVLVMPFSARDLLFKLKQFGLFGPKMAA